jgi:transposase
VAGAILSGDILVGTLCPTFEDGVVQAPAPARLIEGGMPTEATIAQVLVSKYADHLPLLRVSGDRERGFQRNVRTDFAGS